MDAFATSISLALQHGVPLKVLCEKFAHTRFEPSGWTGNEQIGYAKSLMDYIFRWLQLRFLSGTQLALFAGIVHQAQQLPAPPPSLLPETDEDPESQSVVAGVSGAALTRLVEDIARRLNQVNASATGPVPQIRVTPGVSPAGTGNAGPNPSAVPAQAPAFAPSQAASPANGPRMSDRGLYHASDAMREMYDMGDAPSCGTCGAIMVRNGSCYRCMSCGSTSGCS
jgi:ribonucleoside-diphosphate reductase alpha chain